MQAETTIYFCRVAIDSSASFWSLVEDLLNSNGFYEGTFEQESSWNVCIMSFVDIILVYS